MNDEYYQNLYDYEFKKNGCLCRKLRLCCLVAFLHQFTAFGSIAFPTKCL